MSSSSAARSPSPGPAAPPSCGLRRSADSSPFRPIASTTDSPQRSASVGKNSGGGRASSRASWAEKENDGHHHQRDAARTPKPARYSTGGGVAKSFMAPTFSAASKAVAASASPRKKVLGERNNDPTRPVPTSPGDLLAHGKPRGPPPPPPTEEALGAPRRLRLSLDGAPGPPPAAAALMASQATRMSPSLGDEAGEGEVERPVCNVHRHDNEAGDASAPYDPKTNYLSPRPQFLRYRPNPRVEQYRRSGGGGGSVRRLVDGFASSESSDDTTTEEEGISEEEQESLALAPASDASADPAAPVAAGVLPPEPAPVSPPPRAPTPEPEEEPMVTSPRARAPTPELEPAATPERARAKKKKKSSSLRFLLVAPLALVLFMVASFVCVPQPSGSPVVLNASLSKVSEYLLSVQELHPVELAAWLKQWSSSSLDFVTSYWNALASSREQEFFGPHIAANLSAAVADDADHGFGFYYSAAETRSMPTEQEPISAGILEQELDIQEVVSASDTVAIAESEIQDMAPLGDATVKDEPADDAEMIQESATSNVIEELNDYGNGLVVEKVLNAEMAEEVLGSSGEEMASFNQDLDIPSQSEPEPEQTADDMDVPLDIQEVVSASDTVAIAESEIQDMAPLGDATVKDEPADDAEMIQESATSNVIEELNDYGNGLVVEKVLNAEMAEEVLGSSGEEMASFNQDLDIPSQSEPEPEQTADDMDVPSLQQDVQTDESEGDQKEAHVKEDQEAHHSQKLGSDMGSGYLDRLSKPAVAGSVLAVLIVSAALGFLYMRQNRARVCMNPNEPAEQEPAEQVEQVENRSGSGSSEGHTLAKSSQFQSPVVEETERIGGSGASQSQYSSSLSSGFGKRRKGKGEHSLQSLEPVSRRESTGYSTSSYGSFTTYEKIPAKKKNKEDEAMTPVRRSSRLRNQVKSPEA